MAGDINRVTISGNVTREPELRQTASGMAVLTFGMAVNDRRRNQQTGEWENYANFVDVTVFGNRAQSLGGIIRKGMKLSIDGKLRWSQWEARDGSGKRSKVEVIGEEVVLPPRSDQNAQNAKQPTQGYGYAPQHQTAPQNAPQQPQQQASSVYDDDIPF